jgi:hypothetical protein
MNDFNVLLAVAVFKPANDDAASETREKLRAELTAAQDAAISAKLRVQAGTVNLAPLVLQPIVK